MNKIDYKYVYGPVPSRRLGRSLGVDVIPFKICSYDCVYCQLGRTTKKTLERAEYVPAADVLEELKRKLKEGAAPDFISLAGSGEPTLNSSMGELIREIKKSTAIPLAVITNGSLLWMKEVREELESADLILPSLDAGDEKTFQIVNRPHLDISFEKMAEGLIRFRERFSRQIWLEVFLLPDITGMETEVKKIAALIRKIKPDKVQLNSISRPPAERYAVRTPDELMERLAGFFDMKTEVISEKRENNEGVQISTSITDDDVMALLSRRPCAARGVALGLGVNLNEAVKILQKLLERGMIKEERSEKDVFYETVRKTE